MADRRMLCSQPLSASFGACCMTAVAACGVATSPVAAAITVVESGQSIQDVIDDSATADGDVIVVMPGIYEELLDLSGKAITLQSASPLDSEIVSQTVLDGGGMGTVITCATEEGPSTIIEGFTVTGGYAGSGGGMWLVGASPTIRHCVFIDNAAIYEGGAMLADFEAQPAIVNCRFLGNRAMYGGAIANIMSSPLLANCAFSGNVAEYGGPGGAIDAYLESDTLIFNCSFFANNSDTGGAISCDGSAPLLANCILWGDGVDEIYDPEGLLSASFCDVHGGYPGEGNLDADPVYADAFGPDGLAGTEDDDLRLLAESPCLDAGSNLVVPADETDLDADGDTAEPLPLDLDGLPRFADNPAMPDAWANQPAAVDMGAYEREGAGAMDLALPMDFEPWRCPNWLQTRAQGYVFVALLGTAEIDIAQVDPASLELARADGLGGFVAPHMRHDCRRPGYWYWDITSPPEEPGVCHWPRRDGLEDLLLKFKARHLVKALDLDEVPDGESVELVLYGSLLDGTPFTAKDSVMIKGRRRHWHGGGRCGR